jgi:lysozyme
MQASEKAYALIKRFEGLRLTSYQDPVGIWTIGYGTTQGVEPHQTITEAEAEAMLRRAVQRIEDILGSAIHVPLTQDQFDACICLSYNVGQGNFTKSTLLAKLNARDYEGAANEFTKWIHAAGAALPGLVRRRVAERDLFLGVPVMTS